MDLGREEDNDFLPLYQLSSSSGQDLKFVLSMCHVQQRSAETLQTSTRSGCWLEGGLFAHNV